MLLRRPRLDDNEDPDRLTQTHLEQIQSNSGFREVADFFSEVTYLHLVPQLLKYGDLIGGQRLEDDPFGQGFLERIAKATARTRDARLRRIRDALKMAVPQFTELRFGSDPVTGRPHLEARYEHHRPNAGWQREEQFSDGTLRLIGLLWSLLENNTLLLLEEPESSLNEAIVREIPLMLQRIMRASKRARQFIISTHSEPLLSNPGIDANGVLFLEPASDGTRVRSVIGDEIAAIRNGFSIAEAVLPKTRPAGSEQLGLW